jgi:DNA-binding beta-propeller fold protein YncE
MRKILSLLAVGAVAACSAALGASATAVPGFSTVPELSDLGGSVRLKFAVAQYTDATVEVLDSTGKCIRHLAAGRLGPNPPAPFQANSLAQTLTWDKKTDAGKPAPPGCRVRVGLGLTARFDRFYGGEDRGNLIAPGADWRIKGAVADEQGNVFVLMVDGWGIGCKLVAYTRDNHYLRTLMPNYPGDLPADKLRGFGTVSLASGKSMPTIYNGYAWLMQRECVHLPRQGMAITPQGWLAIVGAGGNPWQKDNRMRVLIVGVDGSCPRESFFGPLLPWPSVPYENYYACLAVSPDGKYLYATGHGKEGDGHHSVARSLLDSSEGMEPFLGEDATPGKDETHFNHPKGLATDGKGNLYVSDYGNDRIIVFKPGGAYLAQAPCAHPDQIKVHPRTGEVYVLVLEAPYKTAKVVKYSALPKLEPVATGTLPLQMVGSAATLPGMVLDCAASKPLVWVGALGYPAPELSGIEDQGTTLAASAQKIAGTPAGVSAKGHVPIPAGYLAVDPEESVLYAGGGNWGEFGWVKVDLATGAAARSAIAGDETVFAADGSIFTISQPYDPGTPLTKPSMIRRYDRSEKRIAFAGGRMDFSGPCTHHSRGFTLAPNGDFLVITAEKTWGPQSVAVYGHDCKLKQAKAVTAPNAVGGIQGDRAGNIYIACNVRPKGVVYPGIYGRPINPVLGEATKWPWGDHNAYRWMTGCILKFPPTGGTILSHLDDRRPPPATVPGGDLDGPNVPKLQVDSDSDHVLEVTGPVWQYLGVSPSISDNRGGDPECRCPCPRFTVDESGMIYLADALSFSVIVLDNNKNEVLRFGEYGNADQQGAGSVRPDPPIPFCKVGPLAKVNNSVYVSDQGSGRIVKVKLGYSVVWSSDKP